jgi:hypothetical protein
MLANDGPSWTVGHEGHNLPNAAHLAQSPSLDRGHDAFEVKFLLDEEQAREVEQRLGSLLSLDPHADPQRDNAYRLTTLYCDTPAWNVYRREGRFRLFKCRLRRYGESDKVYLERKSKQRTIVRKKRSTIPLADLARLGRPANGPWDGRWYHHQLLRNDLSPVCLIEYQRVAYFGRGADGPLRLTFDRQIRGSVMRDWSFDHAAQVHDLLSGFVVCEFKFRDRLPALFKTVMHDLQLTPQGVSKYRRCLEACGYFTPEDEPHV